MSVRILLATYQGRRFLPEQLASFLHQTVEWELVANDDGSTDGTLELLHDFKRSVPDRVVWIGAHGPGRGAASNFAHLLAKHGEADHLALSDQDDVWHPERLEVGLRVMHDLERRLGAHTPILVHADLGLINEHGRVLYPSMHRAQNLQADRRRSLRHLLPHNNVTGCTVLMNRALRDAAHPVPTEAIMHDWWLALVATAFGRLEVVDRPLVDYRQHGANAVGAKPFTTQEILRQSRRIGAARSRLGATFVQAEAFLDRYSDRLTDRQRRLVTAYARLPHMNPVQRRASMLRHRFTKPGAARTAGMFALL